MNRPADEFVDGFGVRRRTVDPSGPEPLELLQFSNGLVAAQSFEFMLRERVSRLANFRHAYYSRVRRVDRIDGGSALALVSETPHGARLSRILHVAEASGLDLDINAALCLVRQLVPAVAMLHQNARDVSHGAIGPERIVITPNARVVVVEYVLGAAVEQLGYNRERLWKELRVAAPSSAGTPRINHRTDVMQLGMVAVALIVGRLLEDDDLRYIGDLVTSATESSSGGREPISESLRRWLTRSLQLDSRSSFESALEAQLALDDVLSGESGYIAAPVALETFLARYEECAANLPELEPVVDPPPAPAPEPVRVVSTAPPPAPVTKQAVTIAPAAPVAPAAPSAPVAPVFTPGAPAIEIAPLAAATEDRPRSKSGSRPPAVVAPSPAEPVAPAEDESGDEEIRALFADSLAPAPTGISTYWRTVALGLAVVAIAEGAFIGWRLRQSLPSLPVTSGTVRVDSKPAGAQVKVDGQPKGATPLAMTLGAGAHVMELSIGGEPRVIPITVNSGETLGQYVELAGAPATGRLSVSSVPSGASILLDGQPRGVTPADLSDLPAGDHELVLDANGARARQPVTIAAGTVTKVDVKLGQGGQGAPGAASAQGANGVVGPDGAVVPTIGRLFVNVPFEMQVFEGKTLLGVTGSKLPLPPGPHDLRVVSETLAFETPLHAEIFAGKTTRLPIALPKGTIALNATPWAEVWIDGEKVGETPIGNYAITIGPHEIVFKNPDLGEQHHAATVTAGAPVKLSVDLTKPQP